MVHQRCRLLVSPQSRRRRHARTSCLIRVLAPLPRRHILEPAEDAVEVLHAAETALERNFQTGMIGVLKQITRARNAPALNEFDCARSDFPFEEPHQAAAGDVRSAGNGCQGDSLRQVHLDESNRAPELRMYPAWLGSEPVFAGVR